MTIIDEIIHYQKAAGIPPCERYLLEDLQPDTLRDVLVCAKRDYNNRKNLTVWMHQRSMGMGPRVCPECGSEYTPHHSRQMTCTADECRRQRRCRLEREGKRRRKAARNAM